MLSIVDIWKEHYCQSVPGEYIRKFSICFLCKIVRQLKKYSIKLLKRINRSLHSRCIHSDFLFWAKATVFGFRRLHNGLLDRALVQCHWVSFCYKFLETWADFLDLVFSQRKRFILFKIRLLQVTSCWRQGSFPKTYKEKSLLTAKTSAELLWFTLVLLELFYSSSNLGFPGWQVQWIRWVKSMQCICRTSIHRSTGHRVYMLCNIYVHCCWKHSNPCGAVKCRMSSVIHRGVLGTLL